MLQRLSVMLSNTTKTINQESKLRKRKETHYVLSLVYDNHIFENNQIIFDAMKTIDDIITMVYDNRGPDTTLKGVCDRMQLGKRTKHSRK